MKKKLICIQCPVGCILDIEKQNGEIFVRGNECDRGKHYALQEVVSPKRMITTTVFIRNGFHPLLPVHSVREVPKHLVKPCVRLLSSVVVDAPIHCGDIIYENIMETGVDIIASCDMNKR